MFVLISGYIISSRGGNVRLNGAPGLLSTPARFPYLVTSTKHTAISLGNQHHRVGFHVSNRNQHTDEITARPSRTMLNGFGFAVPQACLRCTTTQS